MTLFIHYPNYIPLFICFDVNVYMYVYSVLDVISMKYQKDKYKNMLLDKSANDVFFTLYYYYYFSWCTTEQALFIISPFIRHSTLPTTLQRTFVFDVLANTHIPHQPPITTSSVNNQPLPPSLHFTYISYL